MGFLRRRLRLGAGLPSSAAGFGGVLLIVIPLAERNFLTAYSSSKRGGFMGMTKVNASTSVTTT